jgi:hypothetical protein
MELVNSIQCNQYEILNPRMQNLAAAPGTPVLGQWYYDTTTNRMVYRTNTGWYTPQDGTVTSLALAAPADFTVSAAITTNGTITLGYANQTAFKVLGRGAGTGLPSFQVLTAAFISDFDTQVRTSRLDQMAAPTGSVNLNSQKIVGLLTPTANDEATNKSYVDARIDAIAQGLDPKPGAQVCTSGTPLPACTYANGVSGVGATLTAAANGTLTINGYAVPANERVLITDQASGFQNGLYIVTQPGSGVSPFILTRDPAMDTSGEFVAASVIVEDQGTLNKNTMWVCTNSTDPVVGTTAITFSLVGGGSYVAGAGIAIVGNTVSIISTYTGQASITTLGTITVGVWNGTTIAVANGGTGATTAAGARANLAAIGSYEQIIGNGIATAFSITQATHGLAANGRLLVAVYRDASGVRVEPDVTVNKATGQVTINFGLAPALNEYRVEIMG